MSSCVSIKRVMSIFNFFCGILVVLSISYVLSQSSPEVYERTKRSIVFPMNTIFYIRLAVKENAFNQTPTYVYALGFKIIWKMPNGIIPHSIKRRSFYEDVESLMDENGLDGRACVLKYICEASSPDFYENQLFRKVARTIFTIPMGIEHQFHPYNVTGNCKTMRHNCPLSILHMQPVT